MNHIHDLCHKWAKEENLILPANFGVNQHNSPLFVKMNSEKHAMNLILEKFGYPIVETESLTFDKGCATERAIQLYRQHGNGVIRGNRMTAGLGTFIIEKEKSIPMMITTLLCEPKGPVLPLFSPYYEAEVEYGVFVVKGVVEMVIAKHKNPVTGLHNLSLGSEASLVTDPMIIDSLRQICEGLYNRLGMGFGRVDVLHTKEGMKIIELSVANFRKFALQNEACMERSKELFHSYYQAFYQQRP